MLGGTSMGEEASRFYQMLCFSTEVGPHSYPTLMPYYKSEKFSLGGVPIGADWDPA